ncbi:MAG: hypothetical protein KAR14_14910 [Candidatus Aminicenantes bacterium]|nr:hypothetical protein [Candidatus Aminicenantes bacterium]
MKKAIMIVLFIMLASFLVQAEDMDKYLSDTQDLVEEGKYQEALKRFQWFHDHALEHEPAMYGVRLSFALSYWKKLGDKYLPALNAIKKTRDHKTDLVAQGKGDRNLFADVMAINRTLEEDTKTVELFRKLDLNYEDMAKQCWNIAKSPVIKAKAYDLAGKYIEDFEQEFVILKKRYDRNKEMYKEKKFGEHFKTFSDNRFVETTIQLIDVAIALGKEKVAKQIQSEALEILDDNRLKDAISE